ncbi:MAG: hypothetical protein AAGI11_13480 [Pseudomonadota bacterium]
MNAVSPRVSARLYLAMGPLQLSRLVASDYRRIEPGDSGELLVLFKLHQRYAELVARQRLLPRYGEAFVVSIVVPPSALGDYALSTVAYEEHLEYLVPVDALAPLSQCMQGRACVVSRFLPGQSYSVPRVPEVP